ncbi:MAG: RebB family R body protein [Myxococcales bacterium]|nr:RebB family R body protein [Myxococcales bacterium]
MADSEDNEHGSPGSVEQRQQEVQEAQARVHKETAAFHKTTDTKLEVLEMVLRVRQDLRDRLLATGLRDLDATARAINGTDICYAILHDRVGVKAAKGFQESVAEIQADGIGELVDAVKAAIQAAVHRASRSDPHGTAPPPVTDAKLARLERALKGDGKGDGSGHGKGDGNSDDSSATGSPKANDGIEAHGTGTPSNEVVRDMSQLASLVVGASPAVSQAMEQQSTALAASLAAFNKVSNSQQLDGVNIALSARGLHDGLASNGSKQPSPPDAPKS